ncbi:MAG: type II toxin-antitoxin system Phd/YefM family antitoxin [bacterium]
MREIGIRELKRRASDVVREVATGAEMYTVTKRGRPVGVLVPPSYLYAQPSGGHTNDAWDQLLGVASKLAAEHGIRASGVSELAAMRR